MSSRVCDPGFFAAAVAALAVLGAAPVSAAPLQIRTPAPGTTVGPGASFEVVAPTGTAKVVFFVDGYRIAGFDGPGYHAFTRTLERAGPRRFVARALDASGSLLDEESVAFTARGLVLSPGDGGVVDAAKAHFAVAPYGFPTLGRVDFTVDGTLIGSATRAPYACDRVLQLGGQRTVAARAYDGAGSLLASTVARVLVRGGTADLTPPSAVGAIRSYQGINGPVKLNERTVAMLGNARRWLEQHGGCEPARAAVGEIVQGSYHRGVSASAGTHDGGGVFDLHMVDLSHDERVALIRALREAGFAAWVRTPPTFPFHIHAVAIGDPDLSPSAANQVRAYFRGLDGLARQGADAHGGPIVKPWMSPYR